MASSKRSAVWNSFQEKDEQRAKCNFCSANLSFKGGSTQNLVRHLHTIFPRVHHSRMTSVAHSSTDIRLPTTKTSTNTIAAHTTKCCTTTSTSIIQDKETPQIILPATSSALIPSTTKSSSIESFLNKSIPMRISKQISNSEMDYQKFSYTFYC